MGTKKKRIPHLLFVCLGNTCRSPMAEAIAKKVFRNSAYVASAGIAPYFDGAVPETVETVQSCFGIDISSHKTQGLEDVTLSDFDYIVAMDPIIFARIIRYGPSLIDKIIRWDIKDLYGQDMDIYIKCAKQIEQHVQDLFKDLNQIQPNANSNGKDP